MIKKLKNISAIKNISEIKGIAPLIVFFVVFGYLTFSAVPHVYWGDSAEMVSVTCDLGVAHSTGYPLYTMAGRLFGTLPIEAYPFRINLMNAFLTAISVTMLFVCAGALAKNSLFAGLITVAGLLGCREFVTYGLFAEVYPLHIVLFSAVLLMIALHWRSRRDIYLLFAILLVGIGLAHHLLMVFVLAALAGYMILLPGHAWRVAAAPFILLLGTGLFFLFKSHETPDDIMAIAFCSMAGLAVLYLVYCVILSIKKIEIRKIAVSTFTSLFLLCAPVFCYIMLPLASARRPVGDWWQPQTVENFFNLLLIQGYESTVPQTIFEWAARLNPMGLFLQAPVFILAPATIGLLFLLWKNTRVGIFIFLISLGTFIGSMIIRHGKPDALRLPIFVLIYLAAGVCAGILTGPGFIKRKWLNWSFRIFFAAIFIAVVGMNINGDNFSYMNKSRAAYELGTSMLKSARAQSILFIGEQSPSIIEYFEACETKETANKNVAIIPVSFLPFRWQVDQLKRKYPFLVFPEQPAEWNDKPIFSLNNPIRSRYVSEIIQNNSQIDALYSDFQMKLDEDNLLLIPHGVVYQLVPTFTSESRIAEMAALDKPPQWSTFSQQDFITAANVASVHNERGKVLLEYGLKNDDETLMKKALSEFNLALDYDSGSAEAMANKGQCKSYFGRPKEGLDLMNKAIAMDPKNTRLHEMIATFYFNMQSPDAVMKAIQHWTMAAQLEPNNPRSYLNIGSAYVGLQQKMEAIAYYQKAMEIDPGYKAAYINLARLYNKLDLCAPASDTLEKIKAVYPMDIDIRSELAQQYADCDLKNSFAREIDSMLNDYPRDAKLYYTLAIIFSRGMQIDNMVKAIKEVKKLEPEFPIRKFFASIQDCERGRALVAATIAMMPEEQDLYFDLAMRHNNCDEPKKAEEIVKEGIKRFPYNEQTRLFFEKMLNSLQQAQSAEKSTAGAGAQSDGKQN